MKSSVEVSQIKDKWVTRAKQGHRVKRRHMSLCRSIYRCTIPWTKAAADKGYLPALHRLAYFYEEGLHVVRDLKKAEALLREGAKKGDADCAQGLGSLLLREDPTPERTKEGLRWLHEAARQGHGNACGALSLIYGFGPHGVARNRQLGEVFLHLSKEALSRPLS